MNLLQKILRCCRTFLGRRQFDVDMDEEMRAHVEMRTQANVNAGMSAQQARRTALGEFGSGESIKETCRDERGVGWISDLLRDGRYGFRQLFRNPGFTVVALVTPALCIGANLAIFAVVDAILLRPLPFPAADSLVTMYNTYPKAGVDRDGASLPNYYERRGNIPAFSGMSIFRNDTAIVGETGSTEQEDVVRVSSEFFTTLGVRLAMGREFTDDEMTYQTDGEAILTDAVWRQDFNADPNVLGRELRVDGYEKTIVGVLPPGFRFLSSKAGLFFPLPSNPEDRGVSKRYAGNGCELIARLKPGVSLNEAQAQIDAYNTLHAAESPLAKMVADAGFRTVVTPLRADHVKAVRSTLLLLQSGGLLLALIGGFNLVNLLLVRASGRLREFAIRRSLGASRRRVVRQVMTETILPAVLGGLLGLAVGGAGIRLLATSGARQLPLGAQILFNSRVASVALLATLILGILAGIPIVWFSLRCQPKDGLGSESHAGTASRGVQRLRHGFVVAQLGLAFVLLTGAGLLYLSLRNALAVPTGFRPDHVLTGQISLPGKNYPDWPRRVLFIDRLTQEIGRQPGVAAAGIINNVPFSGRNQICAITVKGHVVKPGEALRGHSAFGVGGDVFAALGIPLRQGRFLEKTDYSSHFCDVDEDFARRYWPAGGAIGQRLFLGSQESGDADAFTVVGVVGSVKQAQLTEDRGQGAVYFPYEQRTDGNLFAVVRTSQKPEFFGAALQRITRSLDPELPVNDIRSMEVRITDSLVGRHSPTLLAGVFAAVALLLASIGTYGVLAYAVAQRRREIGVRLALGASPGRISKDFLSLGARLLAAGTVLGVVGIILTARAIQSVLFNVPALHLSTLAAAGGIISVVSFAACWLPARRASRIHPMEALRHE